MSFLYDEGVVYREYQVALTTSASTAIPIILETDWPVSRIVTQPSGGAITFLFGNASTILANKTPDATTKALPDGNFTLPDGAIFGQNITQPTQQGANVPTRVYFSGIAATGTPTAIIKLVRMT